MHKKSSTLFAMGFAAAALAAGPTNTPDADRYLARALNADETGEIVAEVVGGTPGAVFGSVIGGPVAGVAGCIAGVL